MRELANQDGVFSAYPDDEGQLSLAYSIDGVGPEIRERVSDRDPSLLQVGRSVEAQLGVDVVRDAGDAVAENGLLHVPIGLRPYTETGTVNC